MEIVEGRNWHICGIQDKSYSIQITFQASKTYEINGHTYVQGVLVLDSACFENKCIHLTLQQNF